MSSPQFGGNYRPDGRRFVKPPNSFVAVVCQAGHAMYVWGLSDPLLPTAYIHKRAMPNILTTHGGLDDESSKSRQEPVEQIKRVFA